MFTKDMKIEGYDDELWQAMQGERRRQEEHIELIASENNASPTVRVEGILTARSFRFPSSHPSRPPKKAEGLLKCEMPKRYYRAFRPGSIFFNFELFLLPA